MNPQTIIVSCEESFFLATPLAVAFAAGVTWLGNHCVQRYVHGRLQRTNTLRERFHRYLDLTMAYWSATNPSRSRRRAMEVRMIIAWRVISAEYGDLARRYRRLKHSYDSTLDHRVEICRIATGGDFQGASWTSDPHRAQAVAAHITKILDTFP